MATSAPSRAKSAATARPMPECAAHAALGTIDLPLDFALLVDCRSLRLAVHLTRHLRDVAMRAVDGVVELAHRRLVERTGKPRPRGGGRPTPLSPPHRHPPRSALLQ